MENKQPVTLACEVGAIPSTDRPGHFALLNRLFAELTLDRERLSRGYSYRFAPSAFDLVAKFVENERKCCPFLTFVIEVGATSEPIALQVNGPEGVHDFLDEELPRPA